MTGPDARRAFAVEVVATLRGSGAEAYWAGGCVRDLLLGLDPADYDVATDARPERVKALFRRTLGVGASFGVIKVLGPKGAGDVEVATFRTDGAYRDGRRPESVRYSTAEFDASRRDFTINGMFYDPVEARVVDHVGGRADLDASVLRAIGDPAARFAEDKLRLLRAVRFASRFGLTIEPATRAAIGAMAGQVGTVSAERIAQELRKMLVPPTRVAASRLLIETGLFAAVLSPAAGVGDRARRLLAVLGHLPERPSFPLALAAIVHDEGRDASMALASALKLPNAERDHLGWLVAEGRSLVAPETLRTARLKRLLGSPGVDDLLALHRAEALATTGDVAAVAYCERYRSDLPAGPIDPPPLLNGHDLMRHRLPPGPRFAFLLDEVRDAQLDGLIATKDEALALVDRLNAEAG